jgi:hypothetical protein
VERVWGESLGTKRRKKGREGGREGTCSHTQISFVASFCPSFSSARLCADPRLSPHALLAPDMALPTVFAEMIDNLATDEGVATRYEQAREGGREGGEV